MHVGSQRQAARPASLRIRPRRLFSTLLWCLLATSTSASDDWLKDPGAVHPLSQGGRQIQIVDLPSLHAEVLVERLKVFCDAPISEEAPVMTLIASVDAPGQWLARDWRRQSMERRGVRYEATLPVEDIHVPVIYCVEVIQGTVTNASPLRMCVPLDLGMESPSRTPWAFVEGFEQGLEGWQLAGEDFSGAAIRASETAHDGGHSLSLSLPARKHSVTAISTRLRGWKVEQHRAVGLRLWLRVAQGEGRARISVMANGRSPEQVIHTFSDEPVSAGDWRKVELPFVSLDAAFRTGINLLSIEFIGVGPAELLVDDIELMTLLDKGAAR